MNPSVTISIVSHGQAHMLPALLAQLDQHCASSIAQVIVTLNLPEPFSVADLGLSYPLLVLHNPSPLGFGGNHNQAFSHCKTAWFLVLNPDIEIQGDVLTTLLAAGQDGVGLIAPHVREPGAVQVTPERGVLTPWELIGKRLGAVHPPQEPVWFPGMFMLFRSAAFEGVRGFDPRFHMYCEDFDICARLRLAGWALSRVAEVEVLHQAQRASHVRLRYLGWHLASLMRVWRSGVVWRYWFLVRSTRSPR